MAGRRLVSYELPEAASTERSRETLKMIQQRVQKIPGVNTVGGLAGLNFISFSNKPNVGTLFILLKPWEERTGDGEHAQEILAKIQEVTADVREARIRVIAPGAIPGLGTSAGFSFEIQQTTSTDDIATFEKVTKTFLDALNKRPEVDKAYTFFTARTPSYEVDLNKEQAKKLGVSIADVWATLSTLLGSRYVNDFTLYGRNFRVLVQADNEFRTSINSIGNYYVRNARDEMIPLSALIETRVVERPSLISHYNIYRSVGITGTPKEGVSSGEALKAIQEIADKSLPAGYAFEYSGLSREEAGVGNSSLYIFAISVLFVYLALAALYESWSVPLSVLLAVPIGAFGAILTLTFIPSINNNIYAQIGLITLIGLAAKNAILIVEFAKERVDAGESILDATLEAVNLRLRPIIMTSLAFILGVLPLAFASGAASESRRTIGWTVFGGMLAATTLAIFVVPVLFAGIAKLAGLKKKEEDAPGLSEQQPSNKSI